MPCAVRALLRQLERARSRRRTTEPGSTSPALGSLARQVAPTVLEQEVAVRGYVPVFIDGAAIEVAGRLFERSACNDAHAACA